MVVLSGFDPGKVLAAIERYRITSLLLVPTMIYALLDHPDIDRYDLSSLEIIYYGASSISPTRLKEAIDRFGLIFFQFYGQAEAPMSVTVPAPPRSQSQRSAEHLRHAAGRYPGSAACCWMTKMNRSRTANREKSAFAVLWL